GRAGRAGPRGRRHPPREAVARGRLRGPGARRGRRGGGIAMARIRLPRLLAVARKEVLQLRRDRRSLVLAFLLPVLLLVLFAYAISWDVRDIRTAVVDEDRTARSRQLVDAFRASGYFLVADEPATARDVGPLMDRGRTRLVLVLAPGFAADFDAGRPAALQAIVDGSDANTATIVLAYVQATVQAW